MKKSILTKIVAATAVLLSVSFASCNEKSSLEMNFVKMNGGKVTVRTHSAFNGALETNPIEVASFEIADTEVTYAQWYEVYQWATSEESDQQTYSFIFLGQEGSDGTDGDGATGGEPTRNKNQPVTRVSWCDAVLWCNAASEKAGLAPVYKYNGNVLREAEKTENATVDASANGYRLPTEKEWEFAMLGGNPNEWNDDYFKRIGDEDARYAYYSSKTANVKSKNPNSAGLYGMNGNAGELCNTITSPFYCRIRGLRGIWAQDFSNIDGVNKYLGFRVARSISK